MSCKKVLAISGLVLVSSISTALAEDFSARLGRVPVDSRTQSAIAGLGHARAELDGDKLMITGEFGGLLGPVTSADLHMGAAVGVRGPVIHALDVEGQTEGEVMATLSLSRAEVAALRAGRLYIQLQSESAPDGNLWGWLLTE